MDAAQIDLTSDKNMVFSEENAMSILSLLDQVSTMTVENYNPAIVIKTVNYLHPLGKEKALEKISTYLKQADKKQNYNGLFWVLRSLFDLPKEKDFPSVLLGKADIPSPDEPKKLPRFPIVIIDDVPLLVVRGYQLGGLPEPVGNHIKLFLQYGNLRKNLLAPTTALQSVKQEFERRWISAYGERHLSQVLETVHAQLKRMKEFQRR